MAVRRTGRPTDADADDDYTPTGPSDLADKLCKRFMKDVERAGVTLDDAVSRTQSKSKLREATV